jgi:predicted RND superfamily exporter protein
MWARFTAWILNHPVPILLFVGISTLFLGYWAVRVETDHTAGQFLSADSKEVQDYRRAGRVFGQSQTFLYLVFEGSDPFDVTFLHRLDSLTRKIATFEGVENVLSLTNVPYLVRSGQSIEPQPLFSPELEPAVIAERLRSQPFLRGLLLSNDGSTPLLTVQIDAAFNDTPERVDLVRRIQQEARVLNDRVALAGYPYLRTQYATRVSFETPLFTLLALLVSLIILYFTFRAWRSVFLPMLIVILAIIWTVGLVSLFDHRLNIVTAVLPALIVVIGIATTIHLSTRYYDQYVLLGDRRKALIQTVHTVGLATFLTALTTAIGFAVLALSGSRLLVVFGIFAAAGIMLLYGLAITLLPIAYLKIPVTRQRTALSTHGFFSDLFDRLAILIKRYALAVYVATLLIVISGVVGVSRISSDIFVFSDFYEDDPVRQELAVFEKHFGGVLPMEVIIEAKKPGQFRSLGNLRRLESLQEDLEAFEPVGRSLTAVDLVKYANQAYFGGNAAAFRLPSNYELPFLQTALKSLLSQEGHSNITRNIPTIVDSTFSTTRVFLGVSDIGTTAMNALADSAQARAAALFPADQYEVFVTGSAITSTRSGENLVSNLIGSLIVALVLISVIMALMFKTLRLTVISLIPNVIPLLLVGAVMGFAGINLKPSTALIFSLAFGIAVDSTIHFLAKYRILRRMGIENEDAIRTTLRETGKAMLFAALVLMGGFLVFTLSSFGGTANMGILTSFTLGAALVSNIILLPALLYRYAPAMSEYQITPDALSGNGMEMPATTGERTL